MCVSTSLPLLLVLSNHQKRNNHTQKQHGFTMHDKNFNQNDTIFA